MRELEEDSEHAGKGNGTRWFNDIAERKLIGEEECDAEVKGKRERV